MTAAVFRAELLRALALLPWLLVCHGLRVISGIAPSVQSGVRIDLLGSTAGWCAGVLSLVVVVRSLWEENPNVAAAFPATRPMSLPVLVMGKVAGLAALIAVPYMVSEAVILADNGQPVRVIGICVLQVAVMLGVFLAVAFALVWCWAGRAQAAVGMSLALLAGVTTVFLSQRFGFFETPESASLRDLQVSVPDLLAGVVALAVVAVCCAWIFRRDRSFRRIPVFALTAAVVPLIPLGLATIRPDMGKPMTPSLVRLNLSEIGTSGDRAAWMEIEPPAPELEIDHSLVWSIRSLKVNGQTARVEPQGMLSIRIASGGTDISGRPLSLALKRYFGDDGGLKSVPFDSAALPAETVIANDLNPASDFDLEVGLLGTEIRWQVVADLALGRQSVAHWNNTRWEIRGSNRGQDSININLVESAPSFWMVPGEDPLSRDGVCDWYFLVRESDGKVEGVKGWPINASDWQPKSLFFSERTMAFSVTNPSEGIGSLQGGTREGNFIHLGNYRLVIVRGFVGRRIAVNWKTPRPIPRGMVRKISSSAHDPALNQSVDHAGELGDAIGMAADWARMGFGWRVKEVLLAAPKEAGFTENEWRNFFRLDPTAAAFHALAGVVLPRAELERETDRFLTGVHSMPARPVIHPLLELALTRGRVEAPRWLHDSIRSTRTEDPGFFSHWVNEPVRKWFMPPVLLQSDEEVVGWFLAQDPDHFVFDPITGKFQIR